MYVRRALFTVLQAHLWMFLVSSMLDVVEKDDAIKFRVSATIGTAFYTDLMKFSAAFKRCMA